MSSAASRAHANGDEHGGESSISASSSSSGPTAVGKSDVALRLCEVLSGELVSVDRCRYTSSQKTRT